MSDYPSTDTTKALYQGILIEALRRVTLLGSTTEKRPSIMYNADLPMAEVFVEYSPQQQLHQLVVHWRQIDGQFCCEWRLE